ncbi:unnamed protein product [Mytilus edulis]|uniref:IgGFc-binding protein N-terminal domain-containing protein n=1 Tax=Mytilus edulis TaxID=6550 RepID=A0A8S3QSM2_MYTED|nr:unnamed protein product [Mytilus edulis]
MDTYADNVLHNNSVSMQKTIERKLNRSLSRRVRRFRNIMHSDIRSTLQHVKNEIDAVLSENLNKSDFKNTDWKRIGKLTEKIKGLSTHLKGYLQNVYTSASADKTYVPLLNKVKMPVMAELDMSNLGEQLKSFMQNKIKNVITEKLVLESNNIQYKLENKINEAIEKFRTSMDTYTNNVLRNNSIMMQKTIERKLIKSLSRRVRRFRNIMHSDIRSTLQHVKNEIDAVLTENYNSSDSKNTDGTRIGKLSGKFKGLSEQVKDSLYDSNGANGDSESSPENNILDHKGKLFYIMFPIQHEWYKFNVQFIITADTPTDVDIISEYAEINRTVVINTGVAYIDIPSLVMNSETGRTFTTVLISADQLVTVVEMFHKSNCNGGLYICESSSFTVLPSNKLGTEYSLTTYATNQQNCGMMASVKNTTVFIESASFIKISVGGATINPGQKFKLVLGYLEGFNINTYVNLTGTKIYANQPIVVISGNKYVNFKEYRTCKEYCDYVSDSVYESLIPADKWSRNFIIPIFHKASSVRIRIVSQNENTTTTIKAASSGPMTVNGDNIEVDLSAKSYYVSSSHPILLSMYIIFKNTDMAMSIVPGIDHFSKEYVIAPPKVLSYTNYISIIIKSSDVDGLRFVGNLLAVESTEIMARNKSFTIVIKKMAGLSVYKIRHVSKTALYGVIVYGFGGSTAYGYPAGFRL